jgi:hypothetical protein
LFHGYRANEEKPKNHGGRPRRSVKAASVTVWFETQIMRGDKVKNYPLLIVSLLFSDLTHAYKAYLPDNPSLLVSITFSVPNFKLTTI